MPATRLQAPQGEFTLYRFPRQDKAGLRAWDAADEYLLQQVAGLAVLRQPVILNDGFGALATALHAHRPIALSDSWLSQQATRQNLAVNGIKPGDVTLLTSLEKPAAPIDVLLIKIPKTLALLEYQLIQLFPLLTPQTQIIAAGMVKHLPKTVWALFEKLIGPTVTSRAQKKARLIQVSLDADKSAPDNPYPSHYLLENSNLQISNHANVFSREKLDIGTRFLLQHLPTGRYRQMIDLGCGNGVVGTVFARQHPDTAIQFVDESFMALDSARINFTRAFQSVRSATYTATDCLTGIAAHSADLIVCNPPFHQQQVVGDTIARRMFSQAKSVLRPGGRLHVIGNRHLNYHVLLKQRFGQYKLVASNRKFVILSVTR